MHCLGILGSTNGTDMLAIIEAINKKQLNAAIKIVLSNKKDAGILNRAKVHGLPSEFLDPTNLSREDYDDKITATLKKHHVNLIVLIGYMRILSQKFVEQWQNKIINVHPSLLPDFAGKMDLQVYEAVLAAKRKETGCTVHYVTELVDAGPILLQKKCPVLDSDTVHTLKARVQKIEGETLVEAIHSIGM